MRLNPRQIEAFRLVYQTGSMTTAAQMLHVSQPAVSRLIRDLEAGLQLTLFIRSGTGLQVTADAIAFYAEVERSFVGLQRLEQAATAIRQKHEGFVHVAATGAFGTQCLPQVMGRLRAKFPDLKLRITVTRSSEVLEMVATHRCHMGITAPLAQTAGIEAEALAPVPLVCVLPLGHPLAAKAVIGFSDLIGATLFGPAEDTRLHQLIKAAFADRGAEFTLAGDCTLGAAICELVAAGTGIAILDAMAAQSGAQGRTIIRPLEEPIYWEPKMLFPVGMARPRPLQLLTRAIHGRLTDLGFGAPAARAGGRATLGLGV